MLLAGLIGGCAAAREPAVMQIDHPVYQTSAELFGKAMLVIEADVSTASRVERLRAQPGTGDDPRANPQLGITPEPPLDEGPPVTVRGVRIVAVFKGAARAGQDIEVQQPGGTIDGVEHRVEGAVPLRGGARYVLFLETFPDSPAAQLSLVQGAYGVDAAGTLSALPGNPISLTRADLDRLAAGR